MSAKLSYLKPAVKPVISKKGFRLAVSQKLTPGDKSISITGRTHKGRKTSFVFSIIRNSKDRNPAYKYFSLD